MGLLTANLDSPMHSCWTNTKHCNAKTNRPCQVCKVHLRDLGNPNVKLSKHRRTVDGLARDLKEVANTSGVGRTALSRERGVVPGKFPNPLDVISFDRVENIGIDTLHQVRLRNNSTPYVVHLTPSGASEWMLCCLYQFVLCAQRSVAVFFYVLVFCVSKGPLLLWYCCGLEYAVPAQLLDRCFRVLVTKVSVDVVYSSLVRLSSTILLP